MNMLISQERVIESSSSGGDCPLEACGPTCEANPVNVVERFSSPAAVLVQTQARQTAEREVPGRYAEGGEGRG